jgi:hypothetical protein
MIKFQFDVAPSVLRRTDAVIYALPHCRAFLTFAACLPRAVRVLFGRCLNVFFRFAAAIAFLMFFRAARLCLVLAMPVSSS